MRAGIETIVQLAGEPGVIPDSTDAINCVGVIRNGEHSTVVDDEVSHVSRRGDQAVLPGDDEADAPDVIGSSEYNDTVFQPSRCIEKPRFLQGSRLPLFQALFVYQTCSRRRRLFSGGETRFDAVGLTKDKAGDCTDDREKELIVK